MAETYYPNTIYTIVDGTPVDAKITNVPLNGLIARTDYLKNRLDTMSAGQMLLDQGALIDSSVIVGTPVYLAANNVYKPAKASVKLDSTNSFFISDTPADIWGLCINAQSNGVGDILLSGITEISFADFASVVEGTVSSGHYYLSPTTPGKLRLLDNIQGAVGIFVCSYITDGVNGKLRVSPISKDAMVEHVHYKYDLGFSHWTSTQAGWTYVIGANGDTILAQLFPPVPLSSAYIELFDTEGGLSTNLKCIYPDTACTITSTSITVADPTHSINLGDNIQARLWFIKVVSRTGASFVTSLTAVPNSPITLTNAALQPASAGDLVIGLDFANSMLDDAEAGNMAVKSVSTDGVMHRGQVVTDIVGNGSVIVTANSDNSGQYSIAVADASWYPSTEILDLNGALEDTWDSGINALPCIVLPQGRKTGVSALLRLPNNVTVSDAYIKIHLWLGVPYTVARSEIASMLTISYKLVAKPGSTTTAYVPRTGTQAIPTASGNLTGGQYMELVLPSVKIRETGGNTPFDFTGGKYIFTINRDSLNSTNAETVLSDLAIIDITGAITTSA